MLSQSKAPPPLRPELGGVTGATVAAAMLTVADALPDPPLPLQVSV